MTRPVTPEIDKLRDEIYEMESLLKVKKADLEELENPVARMTLKEIFDALYRVLIEMHETYGTSAIEENDGSYFLNPNGRITYEFGRENDEFKIKFYVPVVTSGNETGETGAAGNASETVYTEFFVPAMILKRTSLVCLEEPDTICGDEAEGFSQITMYDVLDMDSESYAHRWVGCAMPCRCHDGTLFLLLNRPFDI